MVRPTVVGETSEINRLSSTTLGGANTDFIEENSCSSNRNSCGSETKNAAEAGPLDGAKDCGGLQKTTGTQCQKTLPPRKFNAHEVNQIIGKESRAKGTARAVLCVLGSYVRYDGAESGMAWPSQETLAELCNVTVRTIQRAIKRLVELGELAIISTGTGHRSTRYRLVILYRSTLTKMSPQRRQRRRPNPSPLQGKVNNPQRRMRSKKSAVRRSLSSAAAAVGLIAATTSANSHGFAKAAVPGVAENKTEQASSADLTSNHSARWRAVTAEQEAEAKAWAGPSRWKRYLEQADSSKVPPEGQSKEAARRARADGLVKGVTWTT